MLGIEVNDFDKCQDFASAGTGKTYELNESTMSDSRLFPGATISTCLKSPERGFRAHLKYQKGSKQPLIYRNCDIELVCLSGSVRITFKNGKNQVLKPGTYAQIASNTCYSMNALEDTIIFIIGSKGNLGPEKAILDVEIE